MDKTTLEAVKTLIKNWWKLAILVAIVGLFISGFAIKIGPFACDKSQIDLKKVDEK